MAITRTAFTDDDGSGTTGTVINNAVKTELYDQIDAAIAAVPVVPTMFRCVAYSNAQQTVTADAALTLNAEDVDVTGMHDNVTNNSRITIPTGGDGFYRVLAQFPIDTEATGDANASIRKNGATKLKETKCDPLMGAYFLWVLAWEGVLVATDYVEIFIDKSDGSSWVHGSSSRERSVTLSVVRVA